MNELNNRFAMLREAIGGAHTSDAIKAQPLSERELNRQPSMMEDASFLCDLIQMCHKRLAELEAMLVQR